MVSALAVHAQQCGSLSMQNEAILVPAERSQTQTVSPPAFVTPLAPSGDMHSGVIELLATNLFQMTRYLAAGSCRCCDVSCAGWRTEAAVWQMRPLPKCPVQISALVFGGWLLATPPGNDVTRPHRMVRALVHYYWHS
jgi:hypothetical protein